MGQHWRAVAALLAASAAGQPAVALAQRAAVAGEQSEAERGAAITAAFERWASQNSVEAGAIAVLYRGRPTASLGYGGRQPDEPAAVGSLSKAITALCVSRLIDAGRLDFDTTIGEALAPFLERVGPPADPRLLDVTVGDMLRHRSGIVRAIPIPQEQADLAPGMSSPLEEQVRRVVAVPLQFAPGERYEYSNQAYIVLSLIVQTVTGEDYQDHCARSVLGQTGGVPAHVGESVPNQARSGAGGWAISAEEYARFVESLDPASPEMGAPTKAWLAARRQDEPAYGLGFNMVPRPGGGIVLKHTGLIDATDESASALFAKWPSGWTVALNVSPARAQALERLGSELNRIVSTAGDPGRARGER